MKDIRKKLAVFLIGVVLVSALFPNNAKAAGFIDLDQPANLTIDYHDGDKAIHDAHFAAYKVADADKYSHLILTDEFVPYSSRISGLSNLNDLTQEQWGTIAATLKGYVLADKLDTAAEGLTDKDGQLAFNDLEVGLYLVIGSRATLEDFYTYTAVPFLVFIPDRDMVENDWDYDVTVVPKYTKDYFPPEEEDKFVSRKVVKIWDDEGYETIRPEGIVVHLLKDGEVYDTQTLNKENNWRYAWDNLNAKYDWEVIEEEAEGYVVTITRDGITFTMTNEYIIPIKDANLPIQKRIMGEKPAENSEFIFLFTAEDPSYPMPAGSVNGVKEIKILGAGSAMVGDIEFDKPGTYVYTLQEQDNHLENYVYDDTVYTITYTVTQNGAALSVECRATAEKGTPVENVEFINEYVPWIPNTGMLWWPVPVLLGAGFVFLIVGLIRRRCRE